MLRKPYVWLFALAFLSPLAQAVTKCDKVNPSEMAQNDCLALQALYNNARDNGDWTDETNWNITQHPCLWYGVTCENGRVDRLELSDNNLKGIIPPEIGNLDAMTVLDLSFNDIKKEIPTRIEDLDALETLNLSNNRLSKQIPSELGRLSNLMDLNLSHNRLKRNIPPDLGDLLNLRVLDLSFNRLTGNVPADLGDLHELVWFDLSFNRLDGSISGDLGRMEKLEYFDVSNNLFTDSIPTQLGDLNKLMVLDMSNNGFTGGIPNKLKKLKKLVVLNLSFNKLSGSIPKQLGKKLVKLEQFFLNNNELCGDIPTTLVGMTAIDESNFDFNHLDLPNDQPLKDWLNGHDSAWKKTQSPCYANNLIVDFGPSSYPAAAPFKTGIWELIGIEDRDNNDVVDDDQWVQISTVSSIRNDGATPPNPLIYNDMVAVNLLGSTQNELVVDFPSPTNIWSLKKGKWSSLFPLGLDESDLPTPRVQVGTAALTTGDIDGNGLGDVIFDTVADELWAWMNSKGKSANDEPRFWNQLTEAASPDFLVTGDIDGSGEDDVIGYFVAPLGVAPDPDAEGIWALMNNEKDSNGRAVWIQLLDTLLLSVESIVIGDLDGNGQDDVIVDTTNNIIALMNNDTSTGWINLTTASDPTFMVTGDIDGSGQDDLIAYFIARGAAPINPPIGISVLMNNNNSGGVAEWESTPLTTDQPEDMVIGDLDSNGEDDLIVDFGNNSVNNLKGLWVYLNDDNWDLQLHRKSSDPQDMLTGSIKPSNNPVTPPPLF
jgi:Leucine-rich repeat (LRR) protein